MPVWSDWSIEVSARTFVGIVVEVDAAGPVVAAKTRTIATVLEVDVARAVGGPIGVTPATELDVARVVVGGGGAPVVLPAPIRVSGREPITSVNGRRGRTTISRRASTTRAEGRMPVVDCPECPPPRTPTHI